MYHFWMFGTSMIFFSASAEPLGFEVDDGFDGVDLRPDTSSVTVSAMPPFLAAAPALLMLSKWTRTSPASPWWVGLSCWGGSRG